MITRPRYGPLNITDQRGRTVATVSARSGCATGPLTFASRSIRLVTASASTTRPTDASQRGDSGNRARSSQTITAPSDPVTNSHRHPAIPNGWSGTRMRPRSPAAGIPMNPSV